MDSNGSIWFLTCLYATSWVLMGLCSSFFVSMGSNDFSCVLLGFYSSIWLLKGFLGPYASFWVVMVLIDPYVFLWVFVHPYSF